MPLLALVRVEAGDVGAVDVDLGGALDRPLGHRAADAGPSLIQTAATDQRFFTSGVSPRTGSPSGVSESRPLIA